MQIFIHFHSNVPQSHVPEAAGTLSGSHFGTGSSKKAFNSQKNEKIGVERNAICCQFHAIQGFVMERVVQSERTQKNSGRGL